jgi:hypothetical protein
LSTFDANRNASQVLDNSGNLYGTTSGDGAYVKGTVFGPD